MSTCLCPWARYLISIASLTWAHQGGIGCEKYYNLSADKVCTWPVAPLVEAKWLWRFSWYHNNMQQHFVSSGKRCYTNADIIMLLLLDEKCVQILLLLRASHPNLLASLLNDPPFFSFLFLFFFFLVFSLFWVKTSHCKPLVLRCFQNIPITSKVKYILPAQIYQ